jgi:small subunit ribosomal protein S4e
MQRVVKVDGKVRTDPTYPAGFMDVISIDRVKNGVFRLLYDTKGRFAIQRITPQEAKYKLCKVKRCQLGLRSIPYVTLHDGRTVRYPDPAIKVHDTVKFDLETGKITDFIKFDIGNLVMITGGRNLGRIGVIVSKERHPGSFDIVHIKDAAGQTFATRITNVFVIGKGTKSLISLPRGKGIKKSILEEAEAKKKKQETPAPEAAPTKTA